MKTDVDSTYTPVTHPATVTSTHPSTVTSANFDLTQFVIDDYQKKTSPTPTRKKTSGPRATKEATTTKDLFGTSAPDRTPTGLDYSPSRLNFGSIGGHISQTMIEYAHHTFHWIKDSIDF